MRREPCVCGAEDCPACGRLLGTYQPRPVDDDPEPAPRTLTARQMDDRGTAYVMDRLLREPRGMP